MAKYTVKDIDILYNNKLYKEGTVISLEDAEASELFAYLELIPESGNKSQKGSNSKNKATEESSDNNNSGSDTKTSDNSDETSSTIAAQGGNE
jgi:hypothetical protein